MSRNNRKISFVTNKRIYYFKKEKTNNKENIKRDKFHLINYDSSLFAITKNAMTDRNTYFTIGFSFIMMVKYPTYGSHMYALPITSPDFNHKVPGG